MPVAIVSDVGEILSFEGSLLVKVTVVPPAGAGEDRVTARGAV